MSSQLHLHSYYSLLDGYGSPREYFERAKEIGLHGFALTDHGVQYGWYYFDKIKSEYPDIKICYGVEIYECFDRNIQDPNNKYFHLILIAKNEQARIALNKLITLSNTEGFYYKPRLQLSDIAPYADDLIASSACLASKLAKTQDYEQCIKYIQEYKSVFKHFYLEIMPHDVPEQEEYNKKIIQLAHDTNTEIIITNDCHAAKKEDLKYQGRLVQIAHDSDTMSEAYEGCYMMSDAEIHEVLDKYIDPKMVDKYLSNTDKIIDMCDEVNMPFGSPQLPQFPLPSGFDNNDDYLKYLTEEGWKQRRFNEFDENKQKVYRERLNYELNTIIELGFQGYFLILQDAISYCKAHGQIIGQGRGSAGSSLTCFLLNITNVDPVKYDMPFSRFLNRERVSWPDVDSDLADRNFVIKYLQEKYGRENICQILNISYITPVVSIKDTARVLGIGYNEANNISKKFIYDDFNECLKQNKDLASTPKYQELFDIAGHLCGRPRQVGAHAGGVCVGAKEINYYGATKLTADGGEVIQMDHTMAEACSLVKYDMLQVASLGMLQEIQNDVGFSSWDFDINNPAFENDQDAYDIICQGKTCGIFQLESAGLTDLSMRAQPRNIIELATIISLYRPDSMGGIENYLACKQDPSRIKYIHPDMAQIMDETFGSCVFQEQIMAITKVFGGRTDGGADKFRKAVAKKDKSLVLAETAKLHDEIIANGYDEYVAKSICDEMAEKGGYGSTKIGPLMLATT